MYDLLPTFAEMAGIELNHQFDGRSMLPTLFGKKQPNPEFLYWEFYEGKKAPLQAIRKDDWKMVRFFFDKKDKQQVELYNLKKDLKEERNVVDEFPDIAKELIAIMNREHHDYPNKHVDAN